MQTKIPPPIWLLTFGVGMWFIAGSPYGYRVDIPFALAPALLFGLIGLYYPIAGILRFRNAKTTINPHRLEETSSLVDDGIYRKTRNPMYLGLLLILTGWAVWLGSLTNLVLIVLFMLVITELQIKPEEKTLRKLFGHDYEEYCRKVRRWI